MTPTGGRSRSCSESGLASRSGSISGGILYPRSNSSTLQHHQHQHHDDAAEAGLLGDEGRLPDLVAGSKFYGAIEGEEKIESYFAITIQVSIPFLIAGLGMVGAGLVLDAVQVSNFFYLT